MLVDLAESRPVQRTRRALFDAFVELVLERRYDWIKIADIVTRAGVGRSTFYEHYQGKDELLTEGLSGPLGVLADVITDRHESGRLEAVIEHFWENRRVANVLFSGPTRQLITKTLAGLLEARLTERSSAFCIPPVLLAAQLAGAQVALISAWLAGQAPATARAIADALYSSATASVAERGGAAS